MSRDGAEALRPGEDAVRSALRKLFHPTVVAVAGAGGNPHSMGSQSLTLIREFGFSGTLYAVNPAGEPCNGVAGIQRVTAIPNPVDLCLVAVPARAVAAVVADCAEAGVPIAQILTSGFSEVGEEGKGREAALLKAARGLTRLVGPNCLGIYCPSGGLTIVRGSDRIPGTVSLISQSGGLSVDIIMQAKARGLRLSKLASIGNCVDLSPSDFLTFLGDDPDTHAIGMYLEGLRDGDRFVRGLSRVCRRKPVVILKGGRTGLGARSAASHTGALAGEYAIWQSALSQAGAIEVQSVDDLVATLVGLQRGLPRPQGSRVAFVGNGGGATVLVTDAAASLGLTLAPLTESTQAALAGMSLPPGSTVGNPTDIPAGALRKGGSGALGAVMRRLLADTTVDALITHFNLIPFLNYEDPHSLAQGIVTALRQVAGSPKPVLVGLRSTSDSTLTTLRANIVQECQEVALPCFADATEAAKVVRAVYRWCEFLASPIGGGPPCLPSCDRDAARQLVSEARARGARTLGQEAVAKLLDAFEIPRPRGHLASTAGEAEKAAQAIGFPVALKLDSPDILHKTEAGVVRLDLATPAEVSEAFSTIIRAARQFAPATRISGVLVQAMAPRDVVLEVICGLKRDPVFGPTVLVGLGGVTAELVRDVAMRVIPISPSEAGAMWRELRAAPLLSGYRGRPPADMAALEAMILRVAELALTLPEVAEMDLNPVMVMPEGKGLLAVDCRVLLG